VYDDLIMDHIKSARNYRALKDVDSSAAGTNPLCGDEVLVYVKVQSGQVADIAFQCTCCGISMASASMMTEMLKGRPLADARSSVREMLATLQEGAKDVSEPYADERLALLDTVRRFPTRIQCAALPWSTAERALARVGPEHEERSQ
jgi:nitrogen fixation NifU-like protein